MANRKRKTADEIKVEEITEKEKMRILRNEEKGERDRLAGEKAEQESAEQDEKSADLAVRVSRMKSAIPASFFVRVITGFFFLIACPSVFYVICAVAVNNVVARDVIIFLSEYRAVVMYLIIQCTVALTSPPSYDLPTQLVNCSYATTPMWHGMELLSRNRSELQLIMGNAITLLVELNRIIIEGSTVDDKNHVTGDSLIDQYKTPRTTMKGSKTISLLYDHATCFPVHDTDCEHIGRIPTLDTKGFAGLSALIDFFSVHAMNIQRWDFSDNAHPLTMDDPNVQAVISCMMYDLRAGITQFREILVAEQNEDINFYNALLVLFFILSIVLPFTGFVCCLMPTRGVLISVAFSSHKLSELNPMNEDSSKSALGAAQWNESYTVDAPRYDKGHHAMCVLAASLVSEMDSTMDIGPHILDEANAIKARVATMREEYGCAVAEELSADLRGQGYSDAAIAAACEREKRRIDDEGHIKNPVTQALSNLIIACFAVLSDEEQTMHRYHIPEQHRNSHFNSHAVFLRKLQNLSLNIAATVHRQNKEGGKGKDFSPDFNHHAQTLIQLVASFMTEHVGVVDREMVTRLGGKIPETELTDVEINLTQRTIPDSMREFLTSDNASIQDRNLFERIKKVLHLE